LYGRVLTTLYLAYAIGATGKIKSAILENGVSTLSTFSRNEELSVRSRVLFK